MPQIFEHESNESHESVSQTLDFWLILNGIFDRFLCEAYLISYSGRLGWPAARNPTKILKKISKNQFKQIVKVTQIPQITRIFEHELNESHESLYRWGSWIRVPVGLLFLTDFLLDFWQISGRRPSHIVRWGQLSNGEMVQLICAAQ